MGKYYDAVKHLDYNWTSVLDVKPLPPQAFVATCADATAYVIMAHLLALQNFEIVKKEQPMEWHEWLAAHPGHLKHDRHDLNFTWVYLPSDLEFEFSSTFGPGGRVWRTVDRANSAFARVFNKAVKKGFQPSLFNVPNVAHWGVIRCAICDKVLEPKVNRTAIDRPHVADPSYGRDPIHHQSQFVDFTCPEGHYQHVRDFARFYWPKPHSFMPGDPREKYSEDTPCNEGLSAQDATSMGGCVIFHDSFKLVEQIVRHRAHWVDSTWPLEGPPLNVVCEFLLERGHDPHAERMQKMLMAKGEWYLQPKEAQ